MYSPPSTLGFREQWPPLLPRTHQVGHRGAPAAGPAGPALHPSVFTEDTPLMTAEDIKRMDEAQEWLDCLRFSGESEDMERLVASHFFPAQRDYSNFARAHNERLGITVESASPESTTLDDNSPAWSPSQALSPAAVRAARVLDPTPLLPIVNLNDVVGKSPAERLKALQLTKPEKMKLVVAMAEWIYDVMRSLVDARVLARPWSSYSDMIYRERMYSVDRIGTILASFRELPASVPILALLFVKKFAADIRRGGPLAAALSSGGAFAVDEFIIRAFSAGMMMADKVVHEACFSLKTWSEITDIPFPCIRKMERAAMVLLDFNLYPTEVEWETHLKQLHEQSTRHALSFMGSVSVPPSVTVAIILRDLMACVKQGYKQSSPVFYYALAHGTLNWLGEHWQAMRLAASSGHTSAPSSGQSSTCASSTSSCHKRKLSATSDAEWSTADDPRVIAQPSRKVSRTSLHMAVGSERHRVRRGHQLELNASWTSQTVHPGPLSSQEEPVRPAASLGYVPPRQDLAVVQKKIADLPARSGHALRTAGRLAALTSIHH